VADVIGKRDLRHGRRLEEAVGLPGKEGGIMRKSSVMIAACTTLLWAGTAQAIPTPQQQCDYARIIAWKKYVSCVETVVAKAAKGDVSGDWFAAHAKCRHAYFKKWAGFQTKGSLAGSSCIGSRFASSDSGATVTDKLSGLVWEVKTDDSSVHDKDNLYSWSTGSPYKEDGTAFTSFLADVNGGGFAGASGWRLPTLTELQTIVLDFACRAKGLGPQCKCPSVPCVDPAVGTTQADGYWSSTSYVPFPVDAFYVFFDTTASGGGDKTLTLSVRAVRGGL
jgi:hypothetical protein